ncbi:hypothetical protein K438DRAFT_1579862 [Mycena galopus ATCC 62051]|nr:hypothetical protein K438DRAFT_1579862 [Mycena galopus ATCC 62051]
MIATTTSTDSPSYLGVSSRDQGDIPWIRPMLRVQDKTGEEYLVAFHLADRSRYPAIAEKCKNGYTICVTYAEQHLFADGQIGVRVENEWGVKVLPCTLKELSNIGAKMSNQGVCNVCGASATLKCSRCKLFYCSKTCQNKDWSDAHKAECKVVQQVAQWVSDWNEYEKLKVLERTLGPLI